MKSTIFTALAAFAAREVAGHAMFQQLWVDGTDMGTQCARVPSSNSPVTNVGGSDVRCNAGGGRGVGAKCPVKAGGTVTVEMHSQPGDRSCNNEAIGGKHYGPVMVYLSKVDNAATADGSTGFYKIFENGWSSVSGASQSDDDNWGVKDLNKCCGKMDVLIPKDTADGDYLLRAEVIALHTAGSSGQAQLYMTCYQISVTGGTGTSSPATVKFPGAYKASDPGILVNIHSKLSSYVIPGPAVIEGGTKVTPGSGGCTGCASTCKPGSGPVGSAIAVASSGGSSAGGSAGGCVAAQFGQCGGQGFTGCTGCPSGQTCKAVSAPYYYQCA